MSIRKPMGILLAVCLPFSIFEAQRDRHQILHHILAHVRNYYNLSAAVQFLRILMLVADSNNRNPSLGH